MIVLTTGPLSSTATDIPARITLIAAASPHGPAPTTTTSTKSIGRLVYVGLCRGRSETGAYAAPVSASTPMI